MATLVPNWFIALVLPDQSGWEHCAGDLPVGMRRFHPDDLHLTVAFLGACGEERAHQAWEALATAQHPAIPVTAGPWRAMGSPRSPSAYALTLAEGRAPTAALMADWGRRALATAERPVEGRSPLPHVTLARPTRRLRDQLREPMACWLQTAPVPATPVPLEQLALYTWAEDRSQRLFKTVTVRSLAGT